MTYYIYHIPGKKIGVTCDLNNRVTVQQGYGPDEYEVLESSTDVDYISNKERKLQKEYGYRVDMVPYKNLKPKSKMKINVTEQTTTFPCPVDKLKGRLFDNIGMTWLTEHGELHINRNTISWIMDNVKPSMYNNTRCYVYNKAFARAYENRNMFEDIKPVVKCSKKLDDNQEEVVDAIGDMVVVLTNLAHLRGVHIETCIAEAYNVISKRTGKMINGTFVKDED